MADDDNCSMENEEEEEEEEEEEGERLMIGSLDSIQRLHVRTVPLQRQQPRRIVHLGATKALAVATIDHAQPLEAHHIRFMSAANFTDLASFALEPTEECLCLCSLWDYGDGGDGSGGTEYLLVGTGFGADETEYEPTAGRLLVLQLSDTNKSKANNTALSALSSPSPPSSPSRLSPSPFAAGAAATSPALSPGGGGEGVGSSASSWRVEVVCERATKGAVHDVSVLAQTKRQQAGSAEAAAETTGFSTSTTTPTSSGGSESTVSAAAVLPAAVVSPRVVCGVNTKVLVFKWTTTTSHQTAAASHLAMSGALTLPARKSLEPECSHAGNIVALHVRCLPPPPLSTSPSSTSPSSTSSSSMPGSGPTGGGDGSGGGGSKGGGPLSGALIVVGDLMRSVSVLEFTQKGGSSGGGGGGGGVVATSSLLEVARDNNANWMTALEPMHRDFYVGAEHMNNLVTLRRHPNGATQEDRSRLEPYGAFHLGDFVNRFRAGTLAVPSSSTASSSSSTTNQRKDHTRQQQQQQQQQQPGSSNSLEATAAAAAAVDSAADSATTSLLFGTVGGMLGAVLSVDERTYHLFVGVQRALAKVVLRGSGPLASVGGLSHGLWRSFENEAKVADCKNVVDGDLVESFLDLDSKDMDAVVRLIIDDGWVAADFGTPSTSIAGLGASPLPPAAAASSTNADPLLVRAELIRRIEDMARRH